MVELLSRQINLKKILLLGKSRLRKKRMMIKIVKLRKRKTRTTLPKMKMGMPRRTLNQQRKRKQDGLPIKGSLLTIQQTQVSKCRKNAILLKLREKLLPRKSCKQSKRLRHRRLRSIKPNRLKPKTY